MLRRVRGRSRGAENRESWNESMTLYLVDGIDWKHGILGEKTVVAVYNEVWKWPMKLKLDGINLTEVLLLVFSTTNCLRFLCACLSVRY